MHARGITSEGRRRLGQSRCHRWCWCWSRCQRPYQPCRSALWWNAFRDTRWLFSLSSSANLLHQRVHFLQKRSVGVDRRRVKLVIPTPNHICVKCNVSANSHKTGSRLGHSVGILMNCRWSRYKRVPKILRRTTGETSSDHEHQNTKARIVGRTAPATHLACRRPPSSASSHVKQSLGAGERGGGCLRRCPPKVVRNILLMESCRAPADERNCIQDAVYSDTKSSSARASQRAETA